jgi:hypothetical protein
MRNRDVPETLDGKPFPAGVEPSGELYRDYRLMPVRERWPLAQARADAIVAAQAEWDRACGELRERLGLAELDRQLEAAYAKLAAAVTAIRCAYLPSAEAVKAKARIAIESVDLIGRDCAAELAWKVVRAAAA